mmetsp:Transcript_31585/g.60917  ORF Transcript_31585/g.60917 Transcript_31585/m.60917 type:complete len:242 (-) Transcript_31585:949-1674(-)
MQGRGGAHEAAALEEAPNLPLDGLLLREAGGRHRAHGRAGLDVGVPGHLQRHAHPVHAASYERAPGRVQAAWGLHRARVVSFRDPRVRRLGPAQRGRPVCVRQRRQREDVFQAVQGELCHGRRSQHGPVVGGGRPRVHQVPREVHPGAAGSGQEGQGGAAGAGQEGAAGGAEHDGGARAGAAGGVQGHPPRAEHEPGGQLHGARRRGGAGGAACKRHVGAPPQAAHSGRQQNRTRWSQGAR